MQIITVRGINAPGRPLGCDKAPREILEALRDIYSSEKGRIIEKKLLDLEEIHIDNNNLEQAQELICKNAKEIFSEQDKALFLGGDHSISYPIVKAFRETFENPFLIVFDAHVDCMKPSKEVSHEEWLRALVQQGFPAENIVIVSARNIYQDEKIFLEEQKIKIISMQQIQDRKEEICDMLMEKAKNSDGLYISIDIDTVDPAYAPGTGYLEPGGMSTRELLYFLHRLTILKNFKAADIVEINPETDKKNGGRTVKLGAKLLAELL